MLRRSNRLLRVHAKGDVFWRNSLDSVRAKAAESTPLLQERPYPLAEITKRMVRLRVKYEESEDEKEMQLLRGEYKFYTGKAIHFRDSSTSDLVAIISCSGFFGFWDTAIIDRVLEQILSRVHDLSSLELCQLAQDLPLIERARSPQMRMVFKLLCANNCERLREDLSFDDHFDLIENAVGNHCPLLFVKTLLELVEPHIPGYAAFLDDENNNNNSNNNDDDVVYNNDSNTSGDDNASGGIRFKSEGLLSILETVRLADSLMDKSMEIKRSKNQNQNQNKEQVVSQSYTQFQSLKASLVRRLKKQLLNNAKDQISGNFNDIQKQHERKNIHSPTGTPSPVGSNSHTQLLKHNSNESALFPLMPPSVMAKTFHLLASLEINDNNNNNNNSALDLFTANSVLEFFWTSELLRRLSCSEALDLCLGYIEHFGITEYFENEYFIQVAQYHLIDNISFLDIPQLCNAFELIALFAAQAFSSGGNKNDSNNTSTKINILQKRNLVLSDFFDASLEQLLLLRDTGAGNSAMWPAEYVLNQLKSLTVVVDLIIQHRNNSNNDNENTVAMKTSSEDESNTVTTPTTTAVAILHRPQLHTAIKELCGLLISSVRSSLSPKDCATFLAIAATMENFVLDSCVAAVIKRLVKNWVINFERPTNNDDDDHFSTGGSSSSSSSSQLSDNDGGACYLEALSLEEIDDLLLLWTNALKVQSTNNNSDNSSTSHRKVHPLVPQLLIPALRSAQKYKMKEELS